MKATFKKFLSVLSAITLVLGSTAIGFSGIDFDSLFSVKAKAAGVEDLSYKINDDGTVTITSCNESASGELTIPAEIEGKPVTSIGESAFSSCPSLTSINIPDSVTYISDYAFGYCKSLTSIIVDANNPNYSSDENGVLFNKDKTELIRYPAGKTKTEYTVPNSVTSIGCYAFGGCVSLTSINIPDSVTSIGGGAFSGCVSLTSINIPDSVTSIGDYAFGDCTSLTSITIGSGLSSLNLIYCKLENINVSEDNQNFSSIGGALFNKNKTELIQYPAGRQATEYIIPDGVTSIGEDAFRDCKSLTSVNIPDSVTSIGDGAFYGCESLTSINIGANLTSLDGIYSGNLAEINISAENGSFSSDNGVVFNKDKTELIRYPKGKTETEYIIPDGVTSIGKSAFSGCASLTSINIPDSVTSIGDYAFGDCEFGYIFYAGNEEAWNKISGKENVEVPIFYNGVIPEADASKLKYTVNEDSVTITGYDGVLAGKLTIPATIEGKPVTSIGEDAFSGCKSLTSINVPDSVTSIGEEAFYWCESLTSIMVDANNPYYSSDENGALFNKNKTELIQYPAGSQTTEYIIPDGVTSIGGGAFSYCRSLTSINIPDSVTSIGDAFNWCKSLTSITLPDSVTSIDDGAFSRCFSLESIILPNSITSISDYAFFYCVSLRCINIPDGVTSIGDNAFQYCFSLTSINIPDSVISIGGGAFWRCKSLTSIDIPDGVTHIGNGAFSGTSLTSITLPHSITSMGDGYDIFPYSLKDIYYKGTENEWNVIVGKENLVYSSPYAKLHFQKNLPPFSLGDIDGSGDITAADARTALRAAVGLDTLTPEQISAADADKDCIVSAADARLILRAAVGLETLEKSE